MNLKKALLAATSIVLLAGLTAATHVGETDIEPLNRTVIDTNTSINNSNVTKNTLPFNLETSKGSISVNVSLDFPPQTYTGQVILENSYTHSYKLDLQRDTNWTLSKNRIEKDINVGTSGRLTEQSLQLRGNTNTTVLTNISGNISQYLDVTDQVTVFPGVESRVILSYQVPRTTDYGNYTGTLNLTGEYGSFQEIPLHFRFRDNITPEIQSVKTPSFDATFPEQFTVQASDNIGIERVNGTVLRETRRNGTLENRTAGQLQFTHKNNTQRWTATPYGDRNGTYYLKGLVVDETGNKKNFTSKYTVRPLEAVNVDSILELRNYRVEEEIKQKFGEVNRSTPLQITLESFSQPLQSPNETWTLAVQTENGKQFLREENSTITAQGPTDLSLFVYGDTAERFNGELSFQPVKQHVPVSDMGFSGSYLDCAVPQRKTIGVFNKTISFTPVNSDNCLEAGLNISYFISASTIDSMDNIGDNMKVYIPSDVEEEIQRNWQQRVNNKEQKIEKLESSLGDVARQRNVISAILLIGIGGVYWMYREAGSTFYVLLRDTKSLRERLRIREEEEN
jgi:hypothetical protein